MRRVAVLLLVLAAATACAGDDDAGAPTTSSTAKATSTSTTAAAGITFTDTGFDARSDCNSIHLALAAAVDDEPDAAVDYLHPDRLRERGTFDAATVAALLDDPSADRLGELAEVCTQHGYPGP